MKIRTNLTPEQLDNIAKGIKVAAEKQRERPYVPENNAESELLRKSDGVFGMMLDSLQEELASILLDKKEV